jgi:hypothetical protein
MALRGEEFGETGVSTILPLDGGGVRRQPDGGGESRCAPWPAPGFTPSDPSFARAAEGPPSPSRGRTDKRSYSPRLRRGLQVLALDGRGGPRRRRGGVGGSEVSEWTRSAFHPFRPFGTPSPSRGRADKRSGSAVSRPPQPVRTAACKSPDEAVASAREGR